jgi:signal-transduction protein with cAMP-binding, CBS, and nucleotidyltransferase domain
MVAQNMWAQDVGALPVVENHETKRLTGIVTDRDLALRVVGQGREVKATKAGDVMTPNPWACHPTDDLDTALEIMAQHQVRRIPIVNDDGQVVGIIAQADVATRLHNPPKTAAVVAEICSQLSLCFSDRQVTNPTAAAPCCPPSTHSQHRNREGRRGKGYRPTA